MHFFPLFHSGAQSIVGLKHCIILGRMRPQKLLYSTASAALKGPQYDWAQCSSPASFRDLAEGKWSLSLRAQDNAGLLYQTGWALERLFTKLPQARIHDEWITSRMRTGKALHLLLKCFQPTPGHDKATTLVEPLGKGVSQGGHLSNYALRGQFIAPHACWLTIEW